MLCLCLCLCWWFMTGTVARFRIGHGDVTCLLRGRHRSQLNSREGLTRRELVDFKISMPVNLQVGDALTMLT